MGVNRMIYTILVNLDIDNEKILNKSDIQVILENCLNSASISIDDVRIIDIND